jgi:25S rRNA (uracil2634-N3)-methyltransferase
MFIYIYFFIYIYIYIFFSRLHRKVISGFLSNANHMLTENGEVHITHKTAYPFRKWEIVELAEEIGLFLVEKVPFQRWHYPGYMNKRGSGAKINRTFRVGECSTFKFAKPCHNRLFSP